MLSTFLKCSQNWIQLLQVRILLVLRRKIAQLLRWFSSSRITIYLLFHSSMILFSHALFLIRWSPQIFSCRGAVLLVLPQVRCMLVQLFVLIELCIFPLYFFPQFLQFLKPVFKICHLHWHNFVYGVYAVIWHRCIYCSLCMFNRHCIYPIMQIIIGIQWLYWAFLDQGQKGSRKIVIITHFQYNKPSKQWPNWAWFFLSVVQPAVLLWFSLAHTSLAFL